MYSTELRGQQKMMTILSKGRALSALVGGLLLAGNALALPAKVVLKTGTVVPVTLDKELSSDHARKGDTFTATVRSGYMGLPEGTQVSGVVRTAAPKAKGKA